MRRLHIIAIAVFAFMEVAAREEIVDLYVKPGSCRGHIAVVNSQSMVGEPLLREAADVLCERKRFAVRFGRDESVCNGAAIRLTVIDDPADLAPMTVSPEVGRGVLNVAALTNDLSTAAAVERLLPNRVKIEFLRLLCYAFGVGGSQFGGNLLSATSVQDLDNMQPFLPVDVFSRIEASGKRRGLHPEIVAEYHEACEEGWAPAPTNEFQRAIWDKVHAMPTAPIRILPEARKVKE